MTINEMHIAVNLGVQKIASFQVDTLLPQEIDHELNLAILRFVKQRYSQLSNRVGRGFEQSQKRIDDLRNLIVDQSMNTFNEGYKYDSTGGYIYTADNSNIYIDKGVIPLDYLFLISVKADVYYLCNSQITPPTLYLENYYFYGTKVDLTPPAAGYTLVNLEVSASSTWTSLINNPNGAGAEITLDILRDINNYNASLGSYEPAEGFPYETNTLQVSTTSPLIDANHIFINLKNGGWELLDGGYVRLTWRYNNDPSTDVFLIQAERKNITQSQRTAPDATNRISLCKFAQHDDIIYMMNDPFNITDYRSPLYTVSENYVAIYTDNTFVVPRVYLTYLKKPAKVSITDGLGTDLPEHTHPEIVEMTIKSILEGIESQRYQSQSMETFESE
jgi:hypothetical protein